MPEAGSPMPLHAVQIVASVAEEAAGPSYSVRRLAESLSGRGLRSEMLSVGDSPSEDGLSRVFPARCAGVPLAGRLLPSPGLKGAIAAAAQGGAVLHGHGLWLLPNLYPGRIAARLRRPLLVSPRGMLGPDALRFSRHKKRLFWTLAQGPALRAVTCFHATAPQEAEDIRAFGLTAPVAILPNGIDVPPGPAAKPARRPGAPRTLLHLGRIHPKKGIDRLLRAWALLEPDHPDWRLRIVGPSEDGHAEALQEQARQLGLRRATFEGPVYGAEKRALYRAADLFVLPTLHENFGMVVAEALAAGTPVVSTRGAPWQGLRENSCGWWCDHGPDPLAATLAEAMRLPPEALDAMGERGRDWMRRDFSWEGVAASMEAVYLWCLGRAGRPDCVVT